MDYESHYKRYLEVYQNLSMSNGGKTIWIPTDDHNGWYVTEPVDDKNSRAWKEGYPKYSRPRVLPDDLSPEVDRTAYTTISYAKDKYYTKRYFREDNSGIEWMNNDTSRLPDYGELCSWAIFVDIDIHKDYKERPLSDAKKSIIKQRLKLWIEAFSSMSGGSENVKVLDSGGGMYVFVPPSALSPICDKYDREDLNLILNEIGKRVRTVVGELDKLITGRDDAPDEMFSADKVQNKNRQYKTIGSIHKDLNAVVYPINADNISIEHKPVSSIEDSDVKDALEWAKDFTNDSKYRSCVEDIVEYLFQGDFTERENIKLEKVEGSGWTEIIDLWLDDKKERVKKWEASKKERDGISDKKLKTEVTQDKTIAREAIRRVNNKKLKQYIIDFLGSERVYKKSQDEMDFFPFWRSDTTQTGRSAFYDFYEGKARFTDKSDGTSRDIVYWVALEMTYDDERYPETTLISSPSQDLNSSQYAKAVEELRNRGEDVPILLPDTDDGDKLSERRINEVAKDLGIADSSDFISESDKYYLKPTKWNETIERLDHEGISHNRSKREPLRYSENDIYPPHSEKENQRNRDSKHSMLYNKMGYWSDEFESKSQYLEFLDELPKYVFPFRYDGEIHGEKVDGVVAGVFTKQNDKYVWMSRFEPMPILTYQSMDDYSDLTSEVDIKIQKSKMSILWSEEI